MDGFLSKQWVKIGCFSAFFALLGCDPQPLPKSSMIGSSPPLYYGGPYQEQPTSQQLNLIRDLGTNGVQVIQVGQTINLIIPSDLLFASDSANFKPVAQPLLQEIAGYIQTYDMSVVQVSAYSDNQGVDVYKRALNSRQARVVADTLNEVGMETRLLYTVGRAGENPLASNERAGGRSINRRIEITFRYHPVRRNFD